MGIQHIGSRVSIREEAITLNAVPSSVYNKVFVQAKYASFRDLFWVAAHPPQHASFLVDVLLKLIWLILALIIIPFKLYYWSSKKSKLVFHPRLGDDVIVIKFIGHFLHNYASEIEVFTDGRQNDVDLANMSLTWHLRVMQDFDFEVMEYFNGDNDNMDPARKFWFTFSDCFSGRKPLLKHTMLYKLTDEHYDDSPPAAETTE